MLIGLLSCHNPKQGSWSSKRKYPVIDYVRVGKIMDTVNTPYVIAVSANQKHVVFIGCVHDAEALHPQFKIIERYFKEFKQKQEA